MSSRELSLSSWLRLALAAACVICLYWSVVADMAHDWWTYPSLSHGLLIGPLAIYLAWLRRDLTLALPAAPDSRGLVLTVVAFLLYLGGKLGAEFFLPRISLVILIAGLAWTFWGLPRLRTLGFPLLLLATMVPLPALVYKSLTGPLQLLASRTATSLVQWLGVTVYREGNIIHLSNISLGVEEACSGLNSLSALMIASLLLGFLACSRVPARLILFLLSLPLAIAVNVLRVAGTAMLADVHEEFAMGFYHSFSGWLVFVLSFALLYGLAKGLNRLSEGRRAEPAV